jgi:hypothetical protein
VVEWYLPDTIVVAGGSGVTKKEQAFELFTRGKQPNDPEVHALGIKAKTLREYFRLFQKGEGPSSGGSGGDQRPYAGTERAKNLDDSVSVTIAPKTFTMSPTLIWQAREAAIREWGWPADISPEDFLDTFIYIAFKQRGIMLGGYQVIDEKKR